MKHQHFGLRKSGKPYGKQQRGGGKDIRHCQARRKKLGRRKKKAACGQGPTLFGVMHRPQCWASNRTDFNSIPTDEQKQLIATHDTDK